MLPTDGTAHAVDVMLEIAEENRKLKSFYMSRFVPESPVSISYSGREYFWLYARPKEELAENLFSLRDASACKKDAKWVCLNSAARNEDGRLLHLPLLNFCIPASDKAPALIRGKFKSVMKKGRGSKTMPGYLLVSGKSYHYIGLKLLTEEEWLEFMGLALLFEDSEDSDRFSPIDRRWMGHALRRGFGTLRIFGGEKATPEAQPEPCVIAFIE